MSDAKKYTTIASELMKSCADLGLKIDKVPDYPIQLTYMDGIFCATYEPNYKSVISEEGATAEEALEKLRKVLENA